MPDEPQLKSLPYAHRRVMFLTMLGIFLFALPFLILYTSGYRFVESQNGDRVIATTGGAYVSVLNSDTELYVNGEIPQDRRPFSSAFYVQGYDAGVYSFRTQGEGLQTWVKNVTIFPHIVTQVASFNVPERPQVRVVSKWNTPTGQPVAFVNSTSSLPFQFASTSIPIVATTTATTSLVASAEFELFAGWFASTTEEWEEIEAGRAQSTQEIEPFSFGSSQRVYGPVATTSRGAATSTKEWNSIRLYEKGDEVFAQYVGEDVGDAPYYFCVQFDSASSTIERYGEHVFSSLVEAFASSTASSTATTTVSSTTTIPTEFEGQRICRTEIRIDRKWQDVTWFDFFPGSNDLVLMLLEDGLYVVEIDDRSWQNVQLLYPGDDLVVVLDGGRILVEDGDYFLEVFTELIE